LFVAFVHRPSAYLFFCSVDRRAKKDYVQRLVLAQPG
jgi:hypothetical protein